MKKTKLYYNELEHFTMQNKSFDKADAFNKSIEILNDFLKTTKVTDFKGFRENPKDETARLLKETYRPIFELGLDYIQTLSILQIDLTILNGLIDVWYNSTFSIDSNGFASPCMDKEPYTLYAETSAHYERLELCNKIIKLIEEVKPFIPNGKDANVGFAFRPLIYFDLESNKLVPNHNFVVNG
jgi:hypothetical protein